jgi:hypothetical protein
MNLFSKKWCLFASLLILLSFYFLQSKFDCQTEGLTEMILENGRRTCRLSKIDPNTMTEMAESGIATDLINLNIVSLPEMAQTSIGLIYPWFDVLDWPLEKLKDDYVPLKSRRSWTYVGINPHTLKQSPHYEVKLVPLLNSFGIAVRKYEHSNSEPVIILPRVSNRIAKVIFQDDVISGALHEEYPDFWARVISSDLPIILVEGIKKTLGLLSNGFVAINLAGACGGIQFEGVPSSLSQIKLRSDIEIFLQNTRRPVFINFDTDENRTTRAMVSLAAWIHGKKIEERGVLLGGIVTLPVHTKGPDDFLIKYSADEYRNLLRHAKSPDQFKHESDPQFDYSLLENVPWCVTPCEGLCMIEQHNSLRMEKRINHKPKL